MCGVIGLIYERNRQDLGRIAATLLKMLEYRGYDSTGAAIQGEGSGVKLLKGVGAPSVMADRLGITPLAGQILCGQVRWATFGAVDDLNSQPHVVACKTAIYGAHNGNVTNCDALQGWLRSEGHQVLSDNDGEMVVHAVEHYFARELAGQRPALRQSSEVRRACMRAALIAAAARLQGSYAAVVVDPVSRCLWAVKRGSSLYFGIGQDEVGGGFGIASSDLSSVLKLTRVVVPLAEGEYVEFDARGHQLYCLTDRSYVDEDGSERRLSGGMPLERKPVRSRLREKDTALVPPFETFMEQEISAQQHACRDLIDIFSGGTEASQVLVPYIEAHPPAALDGIRAALEQLRDQFDDALIRRQFQALVDLPDFRRILASVEPEVKDRGTDGTPEQLADRLISSEAGFFADLLQMARDQDDLVAVRLLDVLLEQEEVREFAKAVEQFADTCLAALDQGGRIFVVCCGSSYHAAKAAALFFNEMARVELIPVLPGEFRGQYARSLKDGDLFIAVSQSGETKDLIDVMDSVISCGKRVGRIALVNNVNSTLAQEKSNLVVPLRCGPEIAVPATKSFMNQMVLLYCLALRLGERRLERLDQTADERQEMVRDLTRRREKLGALPALIRETFDSTAADIERAAQLLYLRPSIHLLATRITAVAKEGALKIREVVLNHTEGFEGSEFKHGPNTILGFNTLFGPLQLHALLKQVGLVLDTLAAQAAAQGMDAAALRRLIQAVTDSVFSPAPTQFALDANERALLERVMDRDALMDELYTDYPLIYITGPEERDVNLTVSQINTHKIRGAITVVIAEDHPALAGAATKAPANNAGYRSVQVVLPRTNDTLMTVFCSTVVLQRLALKMSLLKKQYLDRLGIRDHGVHPDVPKNVSKSITVD